MPQRLGSLLTASILALAGPALGQSAPADSAKPPVSSTVAPITVQGAAPPKTVEMQSYRLVQKFAAIGNPEVDQIGRWRDPVCVTAVGLVPNQNEAVEARITDVAKAVGLHVRKPGCTANIEIVFTDNPQAVMDTVYKRREYMLGYYHRHLGAHLKQVTRPIQAWRVTATLGGHGDSQGNGPEVIDDPDNHPPDGCGINHNFTVCLQGVFKNVFVVVDNKFLGDNSLGLVSDYLAMVALAAPNSLDGCNELPSVIDLFAKSVCPGRDAPDGLTPADASYLTALYSTDPEQKRQFGATDIADRMAKILNKASVVAR